MFGFAEIERMVDWDCFFLYNVGNAYKVKWAGRQ